MRGSYAERRAAADLTAELATLLPATRPEWQPGGEVATILRDPAGHPFCITDATW